MPKPDRTKEKTPAAPTAEVLDAKTKPITERTKPVNSIAQRPHTPALVLGDFTIRQDDEGRFSLNDLHAAAGGEKRHEPGRWLRYQQAMDLVAELDREQTTQNRDETTLIRAVKTMEGRSGGTFVVRELVYAYAMWISAAFSLQVIRAYDAMSNGGSRHNLSADMTLDGWAKFFRLRIGMMKELSQCTDMGVGKGLYGNLLHVSRYMGVVTEPLHELAPGLRQQVLALEGGAA